MAPPGVMKWWRWKIVPFNWPLLSFSLLFRGSGLAILQLLLVVALEQNQDDHDNDMLESVQGLLIIIALLLTNNLK
jgi:uncharacterized membrane protein